jgi:predicted transcriptional regulator
MKSSNQSGSSLSRRERQIMDIVYQQGRAAAADVQAALPDPPSYSSVRALLGILETKGHLKHIKDGARYVYLPTRPRMSAAKSALRSVMQTFFGNSVEQTVATLLSASDTPLSSEELARLSVLIDSAKEIDTAKEKEAT